MLPVGSLRTNAEKHVCRWQNHPSPLSEHDNIKIGIQRLRMFPHHKCLLPCELLDW